MANIFITTTNKLEREGKISVFLDLMIVFCLAWDHLTMSAAHIHICRILIISHNHPATRTVDSAGHLLSVMLTKFSAWLDLQPIRLVFQSPDLSVWSWSYYLPILIFVISSFILVSLDGWAFYNHYLSTYDIQREGWRVTHRKIEAQVICLYW